MPHVDLLPVVHTLRNRYHVNRYYHEEGAFDR